MSNMVVLGALEFRVSAEHLDAEGEASVGKSGKSAQEIVIARIIANGLVSAGFQVRFMRKRLLSRGIAFACDLEHNVAEFRVFIADRDEKVPVLGVFIGQIPKLGERHARIEIDPMWPKAATAVRRTLAERFAGDAAFEPLKEEWAGVDADE